MRKLLILLLFFFSIPISGSVYNFSNYYYRSESEVKRAFSEFGTVFGQAFQVNMGESININGLIKAGLGFNIIFLEKKGVLSESSETYLLIPSTHIAFSYWNFIVFLREQTIATPIGSKSEPTFVLGGGLGYEFNLDKLLTFMPPVSITPLISYHQPVNFPDCKAVRAYAFHAQAKMKLARVITYIDLGFSYSTFDTNIILADGSYFQYAQALFHASLGIRILFIYYEVSLSPTQSHSFGLTIDF